MRLSVLLRVSTCTATIVGPTLKGCSITVTPPNALPIPNEGRRFAGYLRADGQVGIRNEMRIIPTVGCINALADAMIADFTAEVGPLEGVDGIYAFMHPYGCSQPGDDLARTRSILQDLVKHPNTGGVLVFGLGCESNVVADFRRSLGDYDPQRVKFLVAQESDTKSPNY